MSEQCVYFIHADEDGPIKIGFTSDDPMRRLSQLQTGNAATLKLLGSIKGTSAREKQFHSELSEWRLQGEWFEASPTVVGAIQEAMASETPPPNRCIGDHHRHCSFCFRCQHDVEYIFGDFAANICSDCTELAFNELKRIKAQKAEQ